MKGFWAVCKRELKSYFFTPVAYVMLVIFLAFAGYLTFKGRFFENRQADLRVFFNWLPWLFVFIVPATTMRLWSEERKSGSIELLFTLPITVTQAVLGKFVAAWIFIGIALALTFPLPLTVAYLGNPDGAVIFYSYVGSFLMAGAYLAIGCFFSALAKDQVTSFILAVSGCVILVSLDQPTTLNFLTQIHLPAGLVSAMEGWSFLAHSESMQRGVIEFKDISYFTLMIIGWIAACGIMLNERKAA